MRIKLKNFKWKDRETQQSVLFWAAVCLFIYWGVQRNFNVNELTFGIVVYVLTGQYFFGSKRGKDGESSSTSNEETQRLEKKAESDSKRENPPSIERRRTLNVWKYYRAQKYVGQHSARVVLE